VHQPTWPLLLKIEHMVKLQVLGNNSKSVNNIKNLTWDKNDQHIKIYLPCNFEVNLITRVHGGSFAMRELTSKQKIPAEFVLNTEFKNK
jgi:hypothetical protein